MTDADVQVAGMPTRVIERPWLDHDGCYRVLESRDRRLDGRVVAAVRTTGIYCRPSCPARTPRPANVEFLPTAAAAQVRGYRPCRRCRPDAIPGSPDWDVRADTVARAMRAIEDGVVDREGVDGLAARLGYGRRQLQRLLVGELGAGPLALARARRARTAHMLLVSTELDMAAVAFAAGFSSVRQFNDTIRALHDVTPTALRLTARSRGHQGASSADGAGSCGGPVRIELRLAARPPFAGAELTAFWSARAVTGIEHVADGRFERTLRLPHGHGVVSVRIDGGGAEAGESGATARGLLVGAQVEDWRDLASLVQRVRRWSDLDADPGSVDGVLGADPALGPLVARVPGRRVPGSVDVFETAVRAVTGQQVSVAGARTVIGRLVEAAGEPLRIPHPTLRRVFPGPEQLAAVDEEVLAMPRARRRTLVTLASAVADGHLPLDDTVDRDETVARLLAMPGIGPWTADYVRMRGLRDPDVMLVGDLGVRRALDAIGVPVEETVRWRPWRSYALHHLWSVTVPRRPAGVRRGGTSPEEDR